MKPVFLIICFLLCINNYAQEKTGKCDVKLTKEAFLKNALPTSCFNIVDGENLEIISFKIKIFGHPTVNNIGDSLNRKAKFYLETAIIHDYIIIFDIKLSNENNTASPKSISVEIVEN